MYKISRPNEYCAITGAGIPTVKICKSGFVWPLQRTMRFSVQPRDYPMNLRAMTKEKLQFELPVVFTIGPQVKRDDDDGEPEIDDNEALTKYAVLLANSAEGDEGGQQHIDSIVKGIIEGETRVLVSSMTMEEIFTEREQFKKRIYHNIQAELGQFGLRIYNANVKELKDAPDSNYFASLSRKAHEGASNQARIDVAEAQWKGSVGEAERQGRQNREIAKIHAETAVQKTERDTERSEAEATLATRKTAFDRDVNIAKIEATRATEVRDEELRRDVESKRAQTEMERLRASDVVQATIAKEVKQQAAQARAFEMQTAAEADKFREQKTADAQAYKTKAQAEAKYEAAAKETEAQANSTKIKAQAAYEAAAKEADSEAYKTKVQAEAAYHVAAKEAEGQIKLAEAALIRQSKEAEGLSKMADAYAKLAQAFGGSQGLIQYMMIEKGVYGDLARANATAVQGMQPKMTIWNTGSNGGSSSDGQAAFDPAAVIRNSYQMLPPLMSTIHEQTGITLPEWKYGKLPSTEGTSGSGVRPSSP